MNTRAQRQMIDMLIRYGIRGETDIACIPYSPQKTVSLSESGPVYPLPSATPESVGVSSKYIADLVRTVGSDATAHVHNLLLLCDGKVICDASAPGYSTSIRCLTHSMAKSISALAAGFLIDDGKMSLSTRPADILTEYCPPRMSARMRSLTVWHLLTMSAYVTDIDETSTVIDSHWLKTFFESEPEQEPGTHFKYNSINTYVLSAMICRISGKSLTQLLNERLWRPLGVHDFFAEKSCDGFEKGGWGMFISPHSLAKLGVMFLDHGAYNGKQIISENWIRLMSQTAFVTEESYGDYNYGLHTWIARDKSSVLFNGMLGQNVWMCPENRMVAVITAGNDSFFQRSSTIETVAKFLSPPYTPSRIPLKSDKSGYSELMAAEKGFGRSVTFAKPAAGISTVKALFRRLLHRPLKPLPDACFAFCGEFSVKKNNTGILPLFVRFMQNNHTEGITALTFRAENDRYFAIFTEGSEAYHLEVGIYEPAVTELCFHGEYYAVAATGEFTFTEDGVPVLKLELVYPELPNIRKLKIFRETEGLRIQLSESPGKDMVDGMLSQFVPDALRGGGIAAFVRTKVFGADPLRSIGPAIEPTIYASPLPSDAPALEAPKNV